MGLAQAFAAALRCSYQRGGGHGVGAGRPRASALSPTPVSLTANLMRGTRGAPSSSSAAAGGPPSVSQCRLTWPAEVKRAAFCSRLVRICVSMVASVTTGSGPLGVSRRSATPGCSCGRTTVATRASTALRSHGVGCALVPPVTVR